ncbi:shikimate dehydrogenase [mine drainage metagenome]|uniref:Shikimate dehydrogenase n=1 Tax=mine drainage metagenome TaxID=410659 RepID=A0A1J5T060_9ZZZZ
MQLYGLIGYPLSHSFSKKYFDEKFMKDGITDASFKNYSIDNISLLHEILVQRDLRGLAVTIPYKKAVIDFLYNSTDEVKQMGACNCIKIKDGKLLGHNTDVIGFEKSFIKKLKPHHTKALILGTGGAAAAVEFVLQKLNIGYEFVSRKKVGTQFLYHELNENILNKYSIIINATPIGTFPDVDEAPAIPYQFVTSQHYLFDLVYNPAETKFLQLAKQHGATIQNGYEMLELQAEENWKIWNE